jgi:hypothetical protein
MNSIKLCRNEDNSCYFSLILPHRKCHDFILHSFMKKYLIRWQIKRKQAEKHQPVMKTIERADCVSLLVCIDNADKIGWLKQISLRFNSLNANCRWIVFVRGKKIELPDFGPNMIVVRPKDFGLFGVLRTSIVKQLESKCDLLLNLDRSGNVFLHYLATLIPAVFLIRVGESSDSNELDFYDLTLNTTNMDEADILVNELAGYLRSLNGTENA